MKIKLRARFFAIFCMSILLILSASFFVSGQDAPSDIPAIEDVLTTTGIQSWIDTGWTGEGEHIAILDTGFGGINDLLATSSLTIRLFEGASLDDYNAESIISGTLALETIASIAPDANYSLCRYRTFEEYDACVNWLIESDVDIINHSTGVPAITIDGVNVWEAQGQRAAEAGILWVNAVGDYNGGVNVEEYYDSDDDGVHEFEASETNEIIITPGTPGQQTVALSWSGARGVDAIEIDLNLIVETSDGMIYSSEILQSGQAGDMPLEFVSFSTDMPYTIRILGVTVPGEPDIVLYIPFSDIVSENLASSLISPASFRNVLAVGAIENNVIAPYSSQGPASDNGIKPDMASSGTFILPSGREFRGTGAATGLVSGVAALVSQAYPEYSLQEIFEFITNLSTQDDSIVIGPDNSFGNGYLYIREPERDPAIEPIMPIGLPPQNVDEGFEPPYVEVEEDVSNMREGPGVNYPPVGQVHNGDSFAVNSQADQNNWYQVDHPDAGTAWIPASNVGLHNAEADEIPPADSIPEAPAQFDDLLTPFPPSFTPPPEATQNPEATPDVEETETPEHDDVTLLYGAFWTRGGVNLRAGASSNAAITGRLECGEIVELVRRQENDEGAVWYQLSAGNWVADSVISVYDSRSTADANYNSLYHIRCVPPTETPIPTVEAPTGVPQDNNNNNNNNNNTGGGSVTKYTITIQNNTADCDNFIGNFGGQGFTLDHGQQTSVQLPAGSHEFSGSGTTCIVNPISHPVSGDATISF